MTRTATFNVALSQTHSDTVSVNWATFQGSAIDGQDFTGGSGTLYFAPGEVAKTIDIAVQAVSNVALYFGIKLSGEVHCTLSTANTGVATIAADNTLLWRVSDYYNKKAAYNNWYAYWLTVANNQAGAQSWYNSALSDYNNASANVDATYAAAQSAQNNTNDKKSIMDAYYIWALSGGLSWWVYYAAGVDYNNAKAASDAAWNNYNNAVNWKNACQSTLNDATNNLNTWNNALASTVASRDSAYNDMVTAQYAASAGFVGSTSFHP